MSGISPLQLVCHQVVQRLHLDDTVSVNPVGDNCHIKFPIEWFVFDLRAA
jgi:hypothetical protein